MKTQVLVCNNLVKWYIEIIMMKRSVLFLLLLLPMMVHGAIVRGLYQATVPVASRSQDDFYQALQQAYNQVLIKASGNLNVTALPNVKQNAKQLSDIVQWYNYFAAATDNGAPELLLKISFDPNSIRQILQKAGQILWSRNRPMTIIWLAYNEDHNLRILNNDTDDTLFQTIETYSRQRGLPVLLPMMDLEDMNLISPQDVWTFDAKNLEQASVRYHVDDILAGRLYRISSGEWHADWIWMSGNQPIYWQTQGQTANQAVNRVMDNLTSALAQRYAMFTANALESKLTVKILNVVNLNQYSSVMRYLKSLTPVTQVELLDIQPQDVLVQITVGGGKQLLMQALGQQQMLQPIGKTSDNLDTDLTLKWQGNH